MRKPLDDDTAATGTQTPDRVELLRDVLVFQAKLALDGLLDFLLIPVSFVAALVSFVEPRRERDAFYRVVAVGARADRWINLFGAGARYDPEVADGDAGRPAREAGMDVVVSRIEDYLKREYEEGRMPGPARNTIERVLVRLRQDTEGGDDEKDPGSHPPGP